MQKPTRDSSQLALTLLIVVPLALPSLLRETFFMFRTPADVRGLVCLLELGFVVAWLATAKPGIAPGLTGPAKAMAGLWLVLATVSVAAANYPVAALVRHAEWGCHILFGLALADALSRRPALATVVFAAIVGGFFVVTAGLAAFWAGLAEPAEYDWALQPPFFDHIRHYGYLALAALIACAFPIVCRTVSAWSAAAATAAFTVTLAALLWTGGRGAALGAIAGLAVLTIVVDRGARLRLLSAVAVAVVPAAWLASQFPVNVPIMGLDRMLGRSVAFDGLDDFSTGRAELWRVTAAAIAERPLLGLGPDGFAYLSPPVMKLPVQPHSMPLQVASDWGLPAAAAFAGLLALAGRRWWGVTMAAARRPADRVIAGGIVVALTVHSAVDGTYYHAVPMAILAGGLAVALRPGPPQPPAAPRRALNAAAMLAATAAVTAVVLLHVAVTVVLSRPGVPAPDSLSARLVRGFPSRVNQHTLRPWLLDWEQISPATALDWARWAQQRARHPWWYYYYEADRLAGQDDAAAAAFRAAIHHAPGTETGWLRAQYRDRFGAAAPD